MPPHQRFSTQKKKDSILLVFTYVDEITYRRKLI